MIRPASPQSSRKRPSSAAFAETSGARTGPAGRPRSASAALVRITPWVRKKPQNAGSSFRCRARKKIERLKNKANLAIANAGQLIIRHAGNVAEEGDQGHDQAGRSDGALER